MPCKVLSLSCWWCVIFTINVAKQRYVCEEKMWLCSCVPMYNVHDVVLCCNTVTNVALGLCLVGQPCNSKTHRPNSKQPMFNPQLQVTMRPSQGFCAAQFRFRL